MEKRVEKTRNPILEDIEPFLAAHGMARAKFGLDAVGDRNLVFDLEDGRRLWPETEKKIREFMRKHMRAQK